MPSGTKKPTERSPHTQKLFTPARVIFRDGQLTSSVICRRLLPAISPFLMVRSTASSPPSGLNRNVRPERLASTPGLKPLLASCDSKPSGVATSTKGTKKLPLSLLASFTCWLAMSSVRPVKVAGKVLNTPSIANAISCLRLKPVPVMAARLPGEPAKSTGTLALALSTNCPPSSSASEISSTDCSM